MMVPRPPNIPSSEFISKLGLPLRPAPVRPGTLQQQEIEVAKCLNDRSLRQLLIRMHYRTTYM
jgi:hypothetical protein